MAGETSERKTSKSYLETLKTTFPDIFCGKNTLKEALTKAKNIIGSPYYFNATSLVVIPFDRFLLKYESHKSPKDENRFNLHISFYKSNHNDTDRSVLKNVLVLQYVGDENKDGQQFQESDKLFLNFKQDNVKVLFNLKKCEISFTNGPYDNKDLQTAVINFDQISDQVNLLKSFNENSDMKIFDIEVNEIRKLIAFKYTGKLHGSEIKSITLPLKMQIKLGNHFEINSGKTYKEQKKSIVVRGVNLDINRKGKETVISIKNSSGIFRFTLNELKLLYYKFFLKLRASESAKKIGIKLFRLYILRTTLLKKNPCKKYLEDREYVSEIEESNYILSVLIKKFTESEIMNEEFINELEAALAK